MQLKRWTRRLITASFCGILGLYLLLVSLATSRASQRKDSWEILPWKPLNMAEEVQGKERDQNTERALFKPKSFRRVRVLCWVLTSPSTLFPKAASIRQTWGPRCDKTLYMSSQADPAFPAIGLDVDEGRRNLWSKTKLAFHYIYKHHFQDAEWFMKADDDTFVIPENLRYFLSDKNNSEPVYYGHNFQRHVKRGYMSGGAGYVLSKEALYRFATSTKSHCTMRYLSEDVGMGHCMQAIGVVAGDSRDSLDRHRFLPLSIDNFINGKLPEWYHIYKKYNEGKGLQCCADYLVSCHYVPPDLMRILDYIVYHVDVAPYETERPNTGGNNRTLTRN